MSNDLSPKDQNPVDQYDFDELLPKEFRFRYKGSNWVLREPTEGDASVWRNASMKGTELSRGTNGTVSVKRLEGIAEVEPLLVARCTFRVDDKGEVSKNCTEIQIIRGWGSRVVKDLYARCIAFGSLQEDTSSEAKSLVAVLSKEGSPISVHALRNWLSSRLEDQDCKRVYEMLKPSDEESAKNGQGAMTGYSA